MSTRSTSNTVAEPVVLDETDAAEVSARGRDRVDPAVLAQAVAERVCKHPAVARLDGGAFGTVVSYLPGRRVVGVRVDDPNRVVELAVVLRIGEPPLTHSLVTVVDELRDAVRGELRSTLGAVRVDVTVADVTDGTDDDSDIENDGTGGDDTGSAADGTAAVAAARA